MARATITLSRSALLKNYQILSLTVPGQKLLPMVKANAYGHDANFVARTLLHQKNLHGFGVASFLEGVNLRKHIQGQDVPILVFSDSSPWNEDSARICTKYKLEPVLSEISSLLEFQSTKAAKKLKAHVEINTGMNRLGVPADTLALLSFQPTSIFTHLADADHPRSPLTRKQMKCFAEVVEEARIRFPDSLLHFANSSAIFNQKSFELTRHMHLARPGLSLYGMKPFAFAPESGLKRVMSFRAPIINRIYLNPGDLVGYGGIYRCKNPRGEWISIIAAGYADGVFRSLSSCGIATFKKKKFNLLGRVSMDLSAMQGHASLKIGDQVELWGDSIDPYEQAGLAQTVPYELTTRMGERVEKFYE
jgi:alanine racemase